MLPGRLGLEGARIAQNDRHGVIWLGRGRLTVEDGTLKFITAGDGNLDAGAYSIPYQGLSCIVAEPGTTISHDVFRVLARHGTGLVAAGTAGVRFYASMPFGPLDSKRARRQARLWSDPESRILIARRMYAIRLGELFPHASLDALRGMEGARVKSTYKLLAREHGIRWSGRRYDRSDPTKTDPVNEAINHASAAMNAAAMVATAVAGCIPQLGFIHEDSGISFPLDIADMNRHDVTVPAAFRAVKKTQRGQTLEAAVRREIGMTIRREKVVAKMIDRIKELIDDAGDDDCHP